MAIFRAEIAQDEMARLIREVIVERGHPVQLSALPLWDGESREWWASLSYSEGDRPLQIRFKQRRTRGLTKRSVLNALETGLTGIGLEEAE